MGIYYVRVICPTPSPPHSTFLWVIHPFLSAILLISIKTYNSTSIFISPIIQYQLFPELFLSFPLLISVLLHLLFHTIIQFCNALLSPLLVYNYIWLRVVCNPRLNTQLLFCSICYIHVMFFYITVFNYFRLSVGCWGMVVVFGNLLVFHFQPPPSQFYFLLLISVLLHLLFKVIMYQHPPPRYFCSDPFVIIMLCSFISRFLTIFDSRLVVGVWWWVFGNLLIFATCHPRPISLSY